MDLVATLPALLSSLPLLAMMAIASRSFTFGALSMPGFTAFTSLFYFYVMPLMALDDTSELLGLHITTLEWTHVAVGLYGLGALAAFLMNRAILQADALAPVETQLSFSKRKYIILWLIVAPVCAAFLIRYNVSLNYEGKDEEGYNFLNLLYSSLITLAVVEIARSKMGIRPLLVFVVILGFNVYIGFRYRLVILVSAVFLVLAAKARRKIGMAALLGSALVAVPMINVIGATRKYGQGVDLDAIRQITISDAFTGFGGEIGIVYTLYYLAETGLPTMIFFEPYTAAIIRFVPRFLWPSKPGLEYLSHVHAGFMQEGAEHAGTAAPQHFEMLLQFGWLGLPFLSFIYFSIACLIVRAMLKLSSPAKLAGLAVIPAFFGFYMQTRGYFFQTLSDGLAFFLPLVFINSKKAQTAAETSYGSSQKIE